MDQALADASRLGLLQGKPEGALDSTGLSAEGRSSHYAKRAGQKRYKNPKWPKLTLLIHTPSHLIVSAIVSEGPSSDHPLFAPAVRQAAARVTFDRLLADTGYDAEKHHRLGREELGIRSTVIPLNRRIHGRKWPKTKYRRQLKRRFPKRKYGQRWQVESVVSRLKRRLGWVLSAKKPETQVLECQNRVLTHNFMIL
jgi:hypothetical protein